MVRECKHANVFASCNVPPVSTLQLRSFSTERTLLPIRALAKKEEICTDNLTHTSCQIAHLEHEWVLEYTSPQYTYRICTYFREYYFSQIA